MINKSHSWILTTISDAVKAVQIIPESQTVLILKLGQYKPTWPKQTNNMANTDDSQYNSANIDLWLNHKNNLEKGIKLYIVPFIELFRI